MSTIKVNKIENTATSDGGIAIDSTGHVQLDGVQLPTTGQLSNRNIVINGAMTVSQRSTSETGQTSLDAYVTVDRFRIQLNSSGTFTISQSTEAPDGFANSLKFDCTTADASPNYLVVFQDLEGQDLQHIQKGKSTAQKLTASFYVRSSKTGTYQVNLRDLDNTRLVGASYSISSANTWEYKTVTFAADTTGQLGNDNGGSLRIEWWLAAGSGYSGGTMPTAWEALANTDRAAALNVDIGTSTSDDFYITGVQLEVGDKATPFEHRSYGDELAKCQRYYQQSYAGASATGSNDGAITASCVGNVNRAFGNVFWANTMRAAPTVTWYSGSTGTSAKWRNHSDSADITAATPVLAIGISGYGFVLTAGISGTTDTLFAHYDADAEL